MVDQFQAFLLLGVTALFVIIAIRLVRSERANARLRDRRVGQKQNRSSQSR
jgi:hypothetical protein